MCLDALSTAFFIEMLTSQSALRIWIVQSISLTFAMAKDDRRERHRSLLHFPEMNIETQIRAIEQKVMALIAPDPETFLVEIKIRPGNNVKIYIDADHGVSIDKLAQYNRRLYREIEGSGFFPNGDFSLEISSPGLDEPLKLHRQYLKNIGRNVEVVLKNGIKQEGKLVTATSDEIVIEEEKGNKKTKELVPHTISYNDIKTTKIQIKIWRLRAKADAKF